MKRGFLKTTRYKRAIENVNTPLHRPREKECPRSTPNGKDGDQAPIDQSCDMTAVGDVYADGQVVAVHTAKKPRVACDEESGNEEKAEDLKGNGKTRIEDNDMDASPDRDPDINIPPRPPPGRPGWGRDPEEEFFHTVPKSHGGDQKKRAVFRLWPRHPKGEILLPSDKFQGTLSPDGYPWGATLYDIFHVRRIPDAFGSVSIMTGSALCAQIEALGGLDVVANAPEIEWAKSEGQPRVVGAADTEELIWCDNIKLGLSDRQDANVGEGEKEVKNGYWHDDVGRPIYIPPSPEIPLTSPFHPSHYPKQWPLIPFEHCMSVLLQERIPLYLLPQNLYVHDPFCLLTASSERFNETSWSSRPDIIRTYNLQFSEAVRSQVEEARKKAEELEEFKARTLIILRYSRTKEQIEKHDPMIEIPLPPYVRRTTKTEESHLYLSPVARVGDGHHSVVYKGEWELPRNIFTKEKVCRLCFKESADKEIQRLKDTGRWEKMLRAASWGPNGFTGRQPTQEDLDAVSDPPKLESDGETIERELICVVPPDAPPSVVVSKLDESNTWKAFVKQMDRNSAVVFLSGGHENESSNSEVACIRINPPFPPESQKSCTHGSPHSCTPPPRTAKFSVVAKLSFEDDPHLKREADNYQTFPEHFFQHYNGYTIVKQLHTVVPVNAIVPQFYGYYYPKGERNKGEPSYLSPILLLEHCGEPIEPEQISVEDQEECASMLLRFQRAGWLHESVAPRNFLVQYGKPTEFPLMRQCKPEASFRLIDFGRSRKYTRVEEKRIEESSTLRMFRKLWGKMGHTFRL